jgi:hypothetical protein
MSPDRTLMAALFTALAAEFADMADDVEGLAALTTLLMQTADAATRPQALMQAQAIDALVQRCLALRDVSTGLAEGRALETVLAEVPLTGLALRLGAHKDDAPLRPADPPFHPADAGDLMLFD